ncbi:MAG: hypothetical protein ACD_37C00412G0002 [uncultured bacterium]|nr:MAG: hypothetical protein ACD_37C00412G0002 [uncultured bacterium]
MELGKKHRIIMIVVLSLIAFSLIASSVLPFIFR